MRKTLLFITLIVASMAYCATTKTEIILRSDFSVMGALVSSSDSTITIHQDVINKDKTYTPKEVKHVFFPDGTVWVVKQGKFIDYKIVAAQQDSIKKAVASAERQRMGDPNYAIGLAMKKTGAVCIGLGVPSLFVGTILCICGNKGLSDDEINKIKTIKDYEDLSRKYTRMNTSGVILTGAGCALTIAGIPLYVHGKKVMNLSVQVSENGAGVAVKF